MLDLDRTGRRKSQRGTVEMLLERNPVEVKGPQLGQRHHLKAPRISQDRPWPVHHPMQPAERSRTLADLLKDFGEPQSIGDEASRALWQTIRDVAPFAAPDAVGRPLWRVSTAPMKGPQIAAQITQACADAQVIYDPPNLTYPFGAYIAVVDVDAGTGVVKVRRFIAVTLRRIIMSEI